MIEERKFPLWPLWDESYRRQLKWWGAQLCWGCMHRRSLVNSSKAISNLTIQLDLLPSFISVVRPSASSLNFCSFLGITSSLLFFSYFLSPWAGSANLLLPSYPLPPDWLPALPSGPPGSGGRRRHRSWRFGSTSECRESPLRSLPTSGNSNNLGKSAASSPLRSPGGDKKEAEVRTGWGRCEGGVRTRWGRDEGEVRTGWGRGEGEMRSRWGRDEDEVRARWGRGEGEVRARWGRDEGGVRARLGRGEDGVRVGWGRGEGEVRMGWGRDEDGVKTSWRPGEGRMCVKWVSRG